MPYTEIVAGITAIITALIAGHYSVKNRQLKTDLVQTEREIDFKRLSTSLTVDLEMWNYLHRDMVRLCDESHIDRFLILRCWNGARDPRWTTAIYQFRDDESQHFFNYISVELDQDYVGRLSDMKTQGYHMINVAELPECKIKSIYQSEGVKHSVWFPVISQSQGDSVSYTYCSFSTHEDEIIDGKTRQYCANIAGELRGILESR